jgi:hypothetical protein
MTDNSKFSLDSFKIRIPLGKVKVINEALNGTWILVNTTTAEVDETTFKKNCYPVIETGIKTRYAIENQITAEQISVPFLTILVNSKTLKQRYFEGITKGNVKEVYNYLMEQRVVSFSYGEFLKGELTDVDFKRDTERKSINNLINGLYYVTKEISKDRVRKHVRKDNKGIEWSDRRTADLRKPFFKVYHKGLELFTHSTEFYNEFVEGENLDCNLDQVTRIEFTVKNKKWFRHFGINNTSLKAILNISDKKMQGIFEHVISKHLDIYEVKPLTIKTDLQANPRIILTAMNLLVEAEVFAPDRMIEILTEQIGEKSQRSKKQKELKLLYKEHLQLHMKEKERKAKLRDEVKQYLFG